MTILNMSTLLSMAPGDVIRPKLPHSDYFWLPNASSRSAEVMDPLFDFLMWVSSISTIAILAAMIYFAIKYKAGAREENQKALSQLDHSNVLEVTWSVVPFFVIVLIFVWGFKGYIDQRTSPKDSYEVKATGQKWKWTFEYPGGYVDDRLHVPIDRDVRVLIRSVDVIHSLFIPEFRTKLDAVPGRFTEIWFHATRAGTYPLFCAEYCGTSHSDMLSEVIVHKDGEFETWLTDAIKTLDDLPPVELGQRMYGQRGCAGCHSTDGSARTGPSFKGIWGKTETLSDGSTVKVDENYIKESLAEPQSKLVKGFPPSMPTFQGQLNDKQINGIIEYIKTLK